MPSPAVNLVLRGGFNPYSMADIAARYSLDGPAGDAMYLIDGSNRLMLTADRSGNSAVNGLVLNASSGNYGSAPSSSALNPAGNFSLVFSASNWVFSGAKVLVSKWITGTNQRTFQLFVSGAQLNLQVSSDGTGANSTNMAASVNLSFPVFTAGAVRADWDATGKCDFYTSTNGGVTWSALGVQQSGTARTPFASTSILEIGSASAGAGTLWDGMVSRVQLWSGAYGSGTLAFDANFQTVAKLAASFIESSVNAATVTINTTGDLGARISGARDLAELTTAKMPAFSASGGYNLATFDGSNDYMKAAAFALNQPESVYLVMNQVSWTNNDTFFSGNASAAMNVGQSPTTPNIVLYAGSSAAQNGGLSVGAKSVLSCVFNGANSSLRVNLGSATTGNPGSNNAGGFILGDSNNGEYANIAFSEVLIRSVADDATTQLKINAFLMKKWGIAA